MSRLPLETSLPVTGIGANQSVGMPRQSILTALTSQVSPRVVTDESQALSRAFVAITGGGAQIAGQLAGIREQQRQEIAQGNREVLAQAGKAGALDMKFDAKGVAEVQEAYDLQNAMTRGKVKVDQLRQEIAEGKFNIGIDEDIADALARITMDESENRSEVFRAAFNSTLRDHAAPMLIAAQQRFKEETYTQLSSVTPGAILSSAEAQMLTLERAEAIIKGAMTQGTAFNKPMGEIVERTIMPAAETLARQGDTKSLAVLMDHLKQHDPAKAAQLQAMGEAVARQNEAAARDETLTSVRDYADTGPAFDRFKLFTDERAKTGIISKAESVRLQNDYLSRQLSSAAANGNVEQARHLTKHLSNSPDAQLLGQQSIRAAVDKHRDITTDRLAVETMSGKREYSETVAELNSRLEKWAKDPNDPEALTLDHYRRAAAAIERQAVKVDKTAVVSAFIAQTRGKQLTGVRPPIAEIAEGLKHRWMEDGIAEFIQLPDGERIWRGVIDPERAAMDAAEQGGVIKEWRTQIIDELNNAQGDSPSMRVAARSYAALFKANPELANDVRSGLTDGGRLRADVLEEAVSRGVPMGDTTTRAVNGEWVKRIENDVMPQVLRLQPVNFTPEQKRRVLWGDVKPEAIGQKVKADLNAALPAEFEQRNHFWHLRFGEAFGINPSTGRDVAISETAVNAFSRLAEEEVTNQLARGNERGAEAAAKKRATERLLREHPPVLWNGVVSIGAAAPHPFTADMETAMLADIAKTDPDASFRDSHVPVFDKSLGGWTLIDMYSVPLSLGNGQPFVWVPEAPKTMEEMMKGVEQRARTRRELTPKMKDFHGPVDFHFGY